MTTPTKPTSNAQPAPTARPIPARGEAPRTTTTQSQRAVSPTQNVGLSPQLSAPTDNANTQTNELDELAATAAATAGMQPSMLDRRNLRQTLKHRMAATKLHDAAAYLTLYRDSPEEQSTFLEGILNGETSFFRDATVFAELSRWCLAWFAQNPQPMRILSAPCSTGEEPYSIAALLEQAGVPLGRFTLEALDLSSLALDRARAAVYTGLSLRNLPQPEQSGFLDRVPQGWRVKKHLRNHVQFRQANLLDPNTLDPKSYDLICSRNLLIYQTVEARLQIAQTLASALAPSGRLILGAADWGRDLDALFRLEEPVNSFALRLRERRARVRVQSPVPSPQQTKPSATNLEPSTQPPTSNPLNPLLSEQLADITDVYRDAYEAYCRGQEREAERLCRQTLYLDNDHLPSLELLAKIHRPQASPRMKLALHARLKRHRTATAAKGGPR
jgi:chemotaxis protein methyltransferase WspC